MALFAGDFTNVPITTSQQAATKSSVVTGCRGVRNPTGGRLRRRKRTRARPVRPKKIKSTETT
jgi:hypothetical protein